MNASPTEKYLSTYATPEIAIASELPAKKWGRVLVVPALAEAELFPNLWRSVITASQNFSLPTLVIVVINAKDSAPAEAHAANQKLAHWLNLALSPTAYEWGQWAQTPLVDLVAIDRYQSGRRLKEKQGVGQARKIGCDLALELFNRRQIEMVGMDVTDADAELPADYWAGDFLQSAFAGLRKQRPVVGLHAFTHRAVPGHERAIQEYETFLQYYVDGLTYADSAYAFQTVGSTLRLGFEAYAEVRGFPDREAGEDFYLLNKLAKVGGVFHSRKTISLSGRPSWRVPFGTGQQVNRLSELYGAGSDYLVYDPRVFENLKKWNRLLREWAETPDDAIWRDQLGELACVAETLGAAESMAAAKKGRKDAQSRALHLQEWFDAFRTLKFVHLVTGSLYPKIPLQEVQRQRNRQKALFKN